MGFFKKLFGGAAAVGGTVAAVKVAQKVKEDNPDGIQDMNGDGVVDVKDYAAAVKQASAEVYADAKEYVEEKAPEVKAKAAELKDKACDKAEEIKADVKAKVEAAKEN